MKKVDARGLACPQPVILTKKEIESSDWDEFIVLVDNAIARENVIKLITNMNHKHEVKEEDGIINIIVKRGDSEQKIEETKAQKIVIVIGSDKMGVGDNTLGSVLMRSYTYTLSEVSPKPECIIFVNSGILLTTEGSEVIDNLKNLESMGILLISCGTCLDFYGLKDKLMVGTVGNMYLIVEKMHQATKIINL